MSSASMRSINLIFPFSERLSTMGDLESYRAEERKGKEASLKEHPIIKISDDIKARKEY